MYCAHTREIPPIHHVHLYVIIPETLPGARPTNDISIEFQNRPNFAVLWFKMFSTDHNEILHPSRQCKISLWSVKHILNQSVPNFDRISHPIEISLVGRAPGNGNGWNLCTICQTVAPFTNMV